MMKFRRTKSVPVFGATLYAEMCCYNTKNTRKTNIRTRLSTVGDRTFPVATARVWNELPRHVMSAPPLRVFSSRQSFQPFFSWFCVGFGPVKWLGLLSNTLNAFVTYVYLHYCALLNSLTWVHNHTHLQPVMAHFELINYIFHLYEHRIRICCTRT